MTTIEPEQSTRHQVRQLLAEARLQPVIVRTDEQRLEREADGAGWVVIAVVLTFGMAAVVYGVAELAKSVGWVS